MEMESEGEKERKHGFKTSTWSRDGGRESPSGCESGRTSEVGWLPWAGVGQGFATQDGRYLPLGTLLLVPVKYLSGQRAPAVGKTGNKRGRIVPLLRAVQSGETTRDVRINERTGSHGGEVNLFGRSSIYVIFSGANNNQLVTRSGVLVSVNTLPLSS